MDAWTGVKTTGITEKETEAMMARKVDCRDNRERELERSDDG